MTVSRVRHDLLTVLATVLLVAVLAACNSASPTPSPEPSPTVPPPSAAAVPSPSEAPSAAPSSEPTAADSIYDEIEQEVATLRGLQPTEKVARKTLDAAQLAAEMEKLYHEESPPELVAANERFYKALDLLPPDASLGDLTVEMLSGGVAGYYRDDQKTLYVVSRSGEVGANEKITFAHEFNHALQDQHFTIFKDQEGVTNRSDWLLARQAVYEGDSSLLMTLWASENFTPAEFQDLLAQGLNDPSSAMLERMPAILRETLLYPYTTGLSFAQGQYISGGGWAGVDALYADVPETTEQILHPEKLPSRRGSGRDPMSPMTSRRGSAPTGSWPSMTPSASSRPASGSVTRRRRMRPMRPRAGAGTGYSCSTALAMHGRPCLPRNGIPRRMRPSSRQRRVPWSRRWTIRPRCSPAGRIPAAGSWSRAATTCSRRSPGHSAWRARSPRPLPYIESGAEIPSNARALASVIRAALASASRFAERSGSAGSTTRASR